MRFDQDRSAAVSNQSQNRAVRPFGSVANRRARFMIALGLTAGIGGFGGASHVCGEVTDVVLGSRSFQIPFNIAKSGSPPQEVHLYMAATPSPSNPGLPQGKWQLLDRQAPGVGQFQVSETSEGTYWFATRTIDASGRPHPPGPIAPELKVTIDTTEPVVELVADASAEGKVIAEFLVEDATGVDQMSIHYVTDVTRQWQTASISRTAQGGRFVFEPQDRWQELSLRLRVLDRAGNETIVTKRIQKPRVATKNPNRFASAPSIDETPALQALAGQEPSTTHAQVPNMTPAKPQAHLAAAPFGFPAPYGVAGNSETLPPPSTPEQISQDFGRALPGSNSFSGVELLPETAPAVEDLSAPAAEPEKRPRTAADAMRPLDQPSVTEMVPAPTGQPPAPTQLNRPAMNESSLEPKLSNQPAQTSDVSSDQDAEPTATPSPWSPIDSDRPKFTDPRTTVSRSRVPILSLEELSQRSVVRHSQSRQFSLDYEIEAIGGRGVEAIELYGTTDGGQTWKKWGSDPDRQSPFDIETNGEGIFGFNIVVVAANGLASPSPLPGDVPDIVVVVDETEPEVSITGARYGESDRAGSLVIQYRCQDEYLMTRPIALAFSDSPNGPWTTIAAGLRNVGDYVWPADPQLPRQIYLRIDATDQAGNVGGFVLEEPIDTRGLAPRARIRAFRSIPTP
ncbi:hypothetical protein [Neorhodopirellula pilleata]|uniref:Ser-Thr-rich glycosyl-phosphatidyl-inositol-anchored membrane family protein n=1 Tax=Neorhodopirellula pilleata TaxID=2714738 RepID=A0A5C6AT39_9BACT|nr:hypothetical protein [Neorhodopirellula pilleata]TWU03223.1 hypothetical protein Pla100_01410 [Neorhodopirellula pilleata]